MNPNDLQHELVQIAVPPELAARLAEEAEYEDPDRIEELFLAAWLEQD